MIKIKSEDNDPNSDDLFLDITKEDQYLLQLVDTIPAQIYFDHDVQEKIKYDKHSKMDKKAENLKRKFSNNAELSVKNKHKRARVDPLCHKSVSQIHEEMDHEKKKEKKNKKNGLLLPSASLTRAANIEELQKRLQEKINQLQEKRKGCGNKDPTLKKKLKTKEKKLKSKKNATLAKVNEEKMQTKNLSAKKKKTEEKPMYNKDGKIIYSKLDFSQNGVEEKKKSEFSGKKYKKLLQKAEGKKEKIEKLKEKDPEKATTVQEKELWKKALLKSENVKIKDDPELLKKSLKKQEKMKKKKAKVWKDRVESTETRKKNRQEKRSKNLQKRKKDKLDNKIKRAKKKGRVIPGF